MKKNSRKMMKQERLERINEMLAPAREAKQKSIHSLARIGREHPILRYPILAFLFVFLFAYNLLLYVITEAHVEKRLSQALALVLACAMMIGQMSAFNLTAYAANDTLTIGAFNYATGYFDQASGSGDGTYVTLTIGLTYSQGSIGVSLPEDGSGFTKASSDSYTYKVTLSDKTASQVAEYIKKIKFSGYTTYGFSVSFTVEKTAASFTPAHYAANDHYYYYVAYPTTATTADRTWIKAYEAAKSMTYCGQTGYLATITSKAEEDTIYAITNGGTGWLGGTKMAAGDASGTLYYASFTTSSTSSDNSYWYWACGPERGYKFYNAATAASSSHATQAAAGYYFNWNSGEPNGVNDSGTSTENCLTILTLSGGSGYATGGSACWNDIIYNRTYSTSDGYCPTGYIVEFGSEKNSFGGSTRLFASYNVQSHSHDWKYTLAADGKSISVTCANTYGACTNGYDQNTYTLSLDAADATYTGSAYASLTVSNGITCSGSPVTGCTISSVTYTGDTTKGTTYNSTTPPTKAGYYIASITITGTRVDGSTETYTIQDTFTISDTDDPHGSVTVGGTTFATDNLLTGTASMDPSDVNFYSDVPSVTLAYSDVQSEVAKVEYFYTVIATSDSASSTKLNYTLDELKAKTTGWTTYYNLFDSTQNQTSFSLASVKSIVYVKITDIFDHVTYVSSDVIVVDEDAVAAWYTVDEDGEIVINYGTLEEAVAAGNAENTSSTAIVVKQGATTATSTNKADSNVSIYVPEGTTVSVAGDIVTNPADATGASDDKDSFVTVTSSTTDGNTVVATQAGEEVTVNGKNYTNASAGTETDNKRMLLSVDENDKVVLTEGTINLDKGESVNVTKNGEQVLITNDSTEDTSVVVSPSVGSGDSTITAEDGATVSISSKDATNTYTAVSDGKDNTATTITLKSDETDPVLIEGNVDLGTTSTIAVAKDGSYVDVTASGSSPEVSANGAVEFDKDQVVKINGSEYIYTAAVNDTVVNVTETVSDTEATNKATPVLSAGALTLGTDSVYVENKTETTTTYTKVNNEDLTAAVKPTVTAGGDVTLAKDDSVAFTTFTTNGAVKNEVTADESNTNAVTVSTSTSGAVTTAVASGETVTINGNEYTSKSDATQISSTTDDKTPELIAGQVEVDKDSTIQVNSAVVTTTGTNNATVSANGTIVLDPNSQVTVTSTTSSVENVVKVGSSGTDTAITITAGNDGTISVPLQSDETVTINDNTYTGVNKSGDDATATAATIAVNLADETQTLTSGSVDLAKGSEINVANTTTTTDAAGVATTTTTTATITSTNNTQPTVNADGSVDMPQNCTIQAETNGNTTNISTPVDENAEDTDTTKVVIQQNAVEVNLDNGNEITVDGNNYTAKSDDTTIDVAKSGATLTSGSVELEQNDSIQVNGTSITNVGSTDSKLVVGVNGTTTQDGQKTAEIQVEQGESYRVASAGNEEGYVFTNTVNTEATTTYEIDEEGNLILSGEDIPVTVGDSTLHIGSGTEGHEVTATVKDDGIEVVAGGTDDITITDANGNVSVYKNGGSTDSSWGLVVKEDGGVYIEQGQVIPQAGGIINVEQPLSGGTSEKTYAIKNCGADDSISVKRTVTDGGAVTNQVTFTQAGAKIELTDSTTTSTYTALTPDTVLTLTSDTPILAGGQVELGVGSKVEIDDTGFQVKNAGNSTSVVSAQRKTEGETEYTEINVSSGGVANLNHIVSANSLIGMQIKNTGSTEGSYALQDDGTLTISNKDQVSVTGQSQGTVTVTPGDNAKVNVKATTDAVDVTIPENGDAVTLNVGGTTTTYTAKSDNVSLEVKGGSVALKNGTVGLPQNGSISVGTGDKTYKAVGTQPVEVSMDSTSGTGTMTLSAGAEVALGTSGNVSIKNANESAAALAVNADGTLTMLATDGATPEVTFTIKGSEFQVKADGDILVDETANGPKFTIPKGKTLTITDAEGVEHTYTNNNDDPLVISLDKDGDVALLSGSVSLANGESVYMTDEAGNKILVEATGGNSIMIGADGDIVIPTGSTAVIGGNQYTGTTTAAAGETGKARIKFNTTGGAPILTEGQVDLAAGSSIAKEVTVNGKTEIVEIKNTSTESGVAGNISVGDTITLGENQKADITVGSKTYSLEVPENGGNAVVTLDNSGSEVKLGLDVTPEEGQTKASIHVNGGTYSVDCSDGVGAVVDGKKLALTVDSSDGEVRLDSDSVQTVEVTKGTLTVGTSVITTGETPVTIKQVTGATATTPELTIPKGGEATIATVGSDDDPTLISVPSDATEPVTVEALSNGGLGVNLDAGETVNVNGAAIVAKANGTAVQLDGDVPVLKAGSVDLGEDAVIKIGDSVITNQGDSAHKITAELVEENGVTVPKINVPAGGSYTVSSATEEGTGSTSITYQNNSGNPSSFTLSDDGSMNIPAGTEVPVSINGQTPISISGDGVVETKIGSKGVEMSTENGKSITVGNSTYKNVADATLLLDENGKVELTGGTVELDQNTGLILDSNGTKSEITNVSSDAGKTFDVKKDSSTGAVTMTMDDGVATKIKVGDKEETYTAKEAGTVLNLIGDAVTLTQGTVGLAPSTAVDVTNGTTTLTYGNGGKTGSVDVKKDASGNVTLGVDAGATLTMQPKSENAKFEADLTNNGQGAATYTVDANGYIATNAGDQVTVKQTGKSNKISLTPSADSTMSLRVTEDSVDVKLVAGNELTIGGVSGNTSGSGLKALENGAEISITESGIELENGGVEMTTGSKILVGHSDTNTGMLYESIGSSSSDEKVKVTYDATEKTGNMTIPAGQGVKVSAPGSTTGTYQLMNTSEENAANLTVQEDGSLKLAAGETIGLTIGNKTLSVQAQSGGQGVSFIATSEGPKLVVAAGESVTIDGKEYKNTGSTPLQFILNSDGQLVLEQGKVEAPAGETILVKDASGKTMEVTVENGKAVIERTIDGSGNVTVNAAVTSAAGEKATLKINDATYSAVPDSETAGKLAVSVNGQTGEVSLDSTSTGNYQVTNGALTIGTTTIASSGDLPVYISRPSTKSDPSVTVAPGGNVTLGDTTTGKSVEVIIPADTEDNKTVTLDSKNGQISVDVNSGESITIGGVDYTVGDEGGKLVVDNKTGQLNDLKTTVSTEAKIEAKNFNQDNYTYPLSNNETITVGDKEYQVTGGSAVLLGNADGNPIIQATAGTKITVGGKVYEAKTDNTKFVVGNDGTVTLLDNGSANNSSVTMTGTGASIVDGVTYQASGNPSYTVTYGANGDTVSTPSNTTLSVSLPANKTVYTPDGSYVKATGSGVAVTVKGNKIAGVGYTVLTAVKDEAGNIIGYEAKVVVPQPIVEEDDDDRNVTVPVETEAPTEEAKKETIPKKDKAVEEEPANEEPAEEEISTEAAEEETTEALVPTIVTYEKEEQVATVTDTTELEEVVIEAPHVEITMGEGAVTLDVEAEDGVVNDTLSNILTNCLTAEELEGVKNGASAEIRVSIVRYLEESEVPEDTKTVMESATTTLTEQIEGIQMGQYVEIVLEKNYNNEGWYQIHELDDTIEVVLSIPEDLLQQDRSYYVMRDHDGTCTMLEDLDDDQTTITFHTDRFSTYAILYTDAPEGNQVDLPTINESLQPSTGFSWGWILTISLLLLLLLGLVYLAARRMREDSEE